MLSIKYNFFNVSSMQHGSTELCNKNTDCKNIHAWASGFEKLLEDPKGLQTFAVRLTYFTIFTHIY